MKDYIILVVVVMLFGVTAVFIDSYYQLNDDVAKEQLMTKRIINESIVISLGSTQDAIDAMSLAYFKAYYMHEGTHLIDQYAADSIQQAVMAKQYKIIEDKFFNLTHKE